MYCFSLEWFTNVFMNSLSMCNIISEKDEVVVDEEDFKLLNMRFTVDEGIQLLIKTFTQELMRRVIFSVYQEDRQLIIYYISLKVLAAEQKTDEELLSFALAGSKAIN